MASITPPRRVDAVVNKYHPDYGKPAKGYKRKKKVSKIEACPRFGHRAQKVVR